MHHSIRRILPVFFSFILAASSCLAQDRQDQITVEMIDGKKISGSLEEIDAQGILVGKKFAGIHIDQVISLETNQAVKASSSSTKVHLAGGGLLNVNGVSIDGETLGLENKPAGIDSISLQLVRAIVFEDNAAIQEAIAQPATDEDTVFVKTSTSLARVSGLIESLDAEALQLNFEGKSRPIKREKLAAVIIADIGLEAPQGLIATISLVDGSSIKGALVGFGPQAVTVELSGKQAIAIERKSISRIDIVSDSIAYLASLQPIQVAQQPQFAVARTWQKNRSIEGNPIRLKVQLENPQPDATQIKTFGSGIGISSYSRLVFENENEFNRFAATVGIDAETEGHGDCVMRVEGDGIALWSQRIKGDDTATEINVDISGIREIALIVDPGEQFDLADHADWANARFLKTD